MTYRGWFGRRKRWWPAGGMALLALCLMGIGLMGLTTDTAAQSSGGQICIRAFEDRNGNAQQDPGEPLITRGISASLLSVNGVIIDSRLMEDSPNAAQGTLCFQRLAAAQYTVRVTSASYAPTTQAEYVTAITETGEPVVFSYGAQVIQAAAPAVTGDAGNRFELSPEQQRSLLGRLLLSGLGAVVTMAVMGVIGVIIYVAFYRNSGDSGGSAAPMSRRSPAQAAPSQTPFPGEEPPIHDDDTGRIQTIRPDTDVPESRKGSAAPPDDDFQFDDEGDDPNAPFKPPQS